MQTYPSYKELKTDLLMRGSRKFCQKGSNLNNVFLVDEGGGGSKYHYMRADDAIIGPPAKRHLIGVSLACRRWPKLNVALVAL